MILTRRVVWAAMALLVALAAFSPNTATHLYAQDNTVTIDGSNIVSPALKDAVQAYKGVDPNAKIEVNVSGTEQGFEKLCGDQLDVNMAVRSISDAEAAACAQKNVKYIELLIGYNALVVGINNATKVTCVTPDQLNKALSPAATGIKNWNAVEATLGDQPISLFSTNADSAAYKLADAFAPGDKLRSDLQTVEDSSKVAEKIAADVTAMGILTYNDYSRQSGSSSTPFKALQLKNAAGTCVDPTIPNFEEARYPLAQSLYLYINAARLDRKPASDFLNYLLGSDGRYAVVRSGFAMAGDVTYDRGLNYLKNRQVGRTFSRIQSVNVPADTMGTVAVDGSPALFPPLKAVADAFVPRFTKITLKTEMYSNDIGYRKLCANGVDLVGATRKLTDAEREACQKTNVQTYEVPVGFNAVVLVVNNNNKFATCLTTEQVAKLFSIDSEKKVKKWADVKDSFPATDLLVLTPNDGAYDTDLLMSKLVKGIAPLQRKDVTQNDDALFRAAATQNVEGAITYMSLADFKNVKSNVRTVQIDAGKGCVDPTEANVKNGTYALSEPLLLVLNLNNFSRPEIKAFVWYLLSDDSLTIFSKQGLIGTDTAAVAAAREKALERFTQAPVISAPQSTQAATAAATGAATQASTPAATQAATTAATQASTPAATPAATQAPTAVATQAATPAATQASTPAATEVTTQAATAAPTAAATK